MGLLRGCARSADNYFHTPSVVAANRTQNLQETHDFQIPGTTEQGTGLASDYHGHYYPWGGVIVSIQRVQALCVSGYPDTTSAAPVTWVPSWRPGWGSRYQVLRSRVQGWPATITGTTTPGAVL